ncbi:TetR/AcrR family transcriptional regulator [Colwellia polaris]|jgi:AcrR family transcriptional regulator|uniref:TetR/AcrR family transcriptional regulator n=1 Tax=Colwellia polaris TaxID=326537 RepID=UPI000A171917|nr:TetR/AcrR family transcriptional regulator [Colwellia polaris]|tara:strand:- start:5372 stop:6127 length:756 start_codon:yes stop_codon:yes gene_type:complete
MFPKVLDKADLQARELDIIDATIALIGKSGVENITMDKVVAAVSYSKGTVYKHFLGKEDLFLAVSNHATNIMLDLFMRAAKFDGCSRGRMLLLHVSYLIYAVLHPALFQSVQCARSPYVHAKASEERIAEKDHLEERLMGTVISIIDDAVSAKELVIPSHMTALQVSFSSWSASYGAISLLATEIEQCSGSIGMIVEQELYNQNNLIFDGLQWLPLTKDGNYKATLVKAIKTVFPSELALLKSLGRDFNFG